MLIGPSILGHMPERSCILESAGCMKSRINSASRLNVDLAVESGLAGPDRAEGAKERETQGRSCVDTLYWVLCITTLKTSQTSSDIIRGSPIISRPFRISGVATSP